MHSKYWQFIYAKMLKLQRKQKALFTHFFFATQKFICTTPTALWRRRTWPNLPSKAPTRQCKRCWSRSAWPCNSSRSVDIFKKICHPPPLLYLKQESFTTIKSRLDRVEYYQGQFRASEARDRAVVGANNDRVQFWSLVRFSVHLIT